MDSILTFVALRRPLEEEPAAATLAADSELQGALGAAADADARTAAAKEFVAGGHAVLSPDDVDHGAELVALSDLLSDGAQRTANQVARAVRDAVGDSDPAHRAADLRLARDTVVAAYVLGPGELDGRLAVKIVRALSVAEAIEADPASAARSSTSCGPRSCCPTALVGRHLSGEPAPEPEPPDTVAERMLERYTTLRDQHARITEAICAGGRARRGRARAPRARPRAAARRPVPLRAPGSPASRAATRGRTPRPATTRQSAPLRSDERPSAPTWCYPRPPSSSSPSPPQRPCAASSLDPATTSVRDIQQHPRDTAPADHTTTGQPRRRPFEVPVRRRDQRSRVRPDRGDPGPVRAGPHRRPRSRRAGCVRAAHDPHRRTTSRHRRPLRRPHPHRALRTRRGRTPRERPAGREAHPHAESG